MEADKDGYGLFASWHLCFASSRADPSLTRSDGKINFEEFTSMVENTVRSVVSRQIDWDLKLTCFAGSPGCSSWCCQIRSPTAPSSLTADNATAAFVLHSS